MKAKTCIINCANQFSSVAQSCLTLYNLMGCSMPGFPVHHKLPDLATTHVHRVSDAIQPSHPLLSILLLPSIFLSIRVFSNESVLHIRWPKQWSLSFSISPSNEYSGLISFKIDWFVLLVVQGTLKSPLQHHSSEASILRCSASFVVQLSQPHMTTGKTIALTRWTFVDKVMSLLFNMRSRFYITFFQGQASSNLMVAVTICSDFGAQENKVCHCFHYFPVYLPWSDGTRCHDLSMLNVEF